MKMKTLIVLTAVALLSVPALGSSSPQGGWWSTQSYEKEAAGWWSTQSCEKVAAGWWSTKIPVYIAGYDSWAG